MSAAKRNSRSQNQRQKTTSTPVASSCQQQDHTSAKNPPRPPSRHRLWPCMACVHPFSRPKREQGGGAGVLRLLRIHRSENKPPKTNYQASSPTKNNFQATHGWARGLISSPLSPSPSFAKSNRSEYPPKNYKDEGGPSVSSWSRTLRVVPQEVVAQPFHRVGRAENEA